MKRLFVFLLLFGCSTTTPIQPPRTITHHGCWYTIKTTELKEYGSTIVEVERETWQARCNEDYLERVQRAGCKLLAVNSTTVVVSECKEYIGL